MKAVISLPIRFINSFLSLLHFSTLLEYWCRVCKIGLGNNPRKLTSVIPKEVPTGQGRLFWGACGSLEEERRISHARISPFWRGRVLASARSRPCMPRPPLLLLARVVPCPPPCCWEGGAGFSAIFRAAS